MPRDAQARLVQSLPYVAAGVVILSMWGVIASGLLPGRMASDQLRFHEVVVRLFREQWPDLNLRDYRSATTPGFHIFVAACVSLLGEGRQMLQHSGSLFSAALLLLLAAALERRAAQALPLVARLASLRACALVLLFGASLYVWPAGVWLLPDNAGWLFVLAALLLALGRAERPPSHASLWCLAAGVIALALVGVRQIHLWVAAPLLAAAWVAAPVPEPAALPAHPVAAEFARLTSHPRTRVNQTLVLGLCLVPAFGLVAWFARLWGGLTPPLFQAAAAATPGANTDLAAGYGGANFAAPAFVLALVAIYTPFFAAGLPLRTALARHRGVLLLGASAGLALALIAPTTYDKDAGRWTGLWNFARSAPVAGGRTSVFVAALSAAGGACVALWALALPRRIAWVLFAALVGFMAAQTASHQLWQRYCEPIVLLLLILGAARTEFSWPAGPGPGAEPALAPPRRTLAHAVRVWAWLGPLLLALGFAALTVNALRTSPRLDPAIMDATLSAERARIARMPP